MATGQARLAELLDNNKAFAANYKAPPSIVTIAAMQKKAGAGLIVLTCLDPRVVPEVFLGPGLNAGVIRNAGGRATKDVVNSIVVLRSLLDVKNVMIVHHTDCGMSHLTNAGIAAEASARTPSALAAGEIDELNYGCFTPAEYEEAIRKDVRTLRAAKVLDGVGIYGFGMEINTGVVEAIDV